MQPNNNMIKRNIRDAIFKSFFRDRENVFRLYKELNPEDTDATAEDICVCRLKRVLGKGFTNELGFFVADKLVLFSESKKLDAASFKLGSLFFVAETAQCFMSDLGIRREHIKYLGIREWMSFSAIVSGDDRAIYKLTKIFGDMRGDSDLERIPVMEGGIVGGYADICGIIDSLIPEEGEADAKTALDRVLDECEKRCGEIGSIVASSTLQVRAIFEELCEDEDIAMTFCKIYERKGSRMELSRIVDHLFAIGKTPEEISEIVDTSVELVSFRSDEANPTDS